MKETKLRVKNSAITYTGYEYQTLFGVLKLANWLNNPTEYECICFEADQDDTPQGIDDIVLKRNDGKIDYIQVKFTPSEYKTENAFSWTWLLKVTGKTDHSRSILKKIYDAVQLVDEDEQGNIILELRHNKKGDSYTRPLLNSVASFDLRSIRKEGVNEVGFRLKAKNIAGMDDYNKTGVYKYTTDKAAIEKP